MLITLEEIMLKAKLAKITASIAVAASTMLVSAPSQAGLVWFSRANCINNESITWDWPGNTYQLWTSSSHYNYRTARWQPAIITGWEWTYRSAAVHWGEGYSGGWYVEGNHWRYMPYGMWKLGQTRTTGCNLGFFFPYW
jgi:hypothetical protein